MSLISAPFFMFPCKLWWSKSVYGLKQLFKHRVGSIKIIHPGNHKSSLNTRKIRKKRQISGSFLQSPPPTDERATYATEHYQCNTLSNNIWPINIKAFSSAVQPNFAYHSYQYNLNSVNSSWCVPRTGRPMQRSLTIRIWYANVGVLCEWDLISVQVRNVWARNHQSKAVHQRFQ